MGSLAILAKELGHKVTGCDANVYPPMSTLLESKGIEILQGFDPEMLDCGADQYIVGNAMSRGNPMVEALLNRGLPYISGPQWLSEKVLQGRWVLAVAGTHGKTTTATMLAWILEEAGMAPGFLIGGVPNNFDVSARLGNTDFFVIEADEYDSAFFDKRSKFVHYRPRTVVLNNLEFDHADIFADLAAIQTQFHHLVRIVPSDGLVIYPKNDPAIEQTLLRGCWSNRQALGIDGIDGIGGIADVDAKPKSKSKAELTAIEAEGTGSFQDDQTWRAEMRSADGSVFDVHCEGKASVTVDWPLLGAHNVHNGLAAMVAAHHVGVSTEIAAAALSRFGGVKRRLEVIGQVHGVTVYDDFAHHPTAIATTLAGLRAHVGEQRIVAVIEPRSNTMRMGQHSHQLLASCSDADQVAWFQPPGIDWQLADVIARAGAEQRGNGGASNAKIELANLDEMTVFDDTAVLIETLVKQLIDGDHVVIMSNGGFEGLHRRLLTALNERSES